MGDNSESSLGMLKLVVAVSAVRRIFIDGVSGSRSIHWCAVYKRSNTLERKIGVRDVEVVNPACM